MPNKEQKKCEHEVVAWVGENLYAHLECQKCGKIIDEPSPTKPDTEEWEKEIKRLVRMKYDVGGGVITGRQGLFYEYETMDEIEKDLVKFIRQEKEKSYSDGYEKWNVYARGLSKEAFDNGRHSAYSEIIEMVEGMARGDVDPKNLVHKNPRIRFLAQKVSDCTKAYNRALSDLLSKLKERLNKK